MPTITILINTHQQFHNKATYVFNTFCNFLACQANIIFQQGTEPVHIYYGEHPFTNAPINITHNPQAVNFFQGEELYTPEQVDFAEFQGIRLPFLFSNTGDILQKQEQATTITKDIIATTFYFLSGWQERNQTGEIYEHRHSLQCKCGFTEIPFIDYYTLILRHTLAQAGLEIPFTKKATLLLSHDLDYYNYWTPEHLQSVYKYNLRTFMSRPLQALLKLAGHFITKQYFTKPEKAMKKILKKEEKHGLSSKTFLLAKPCSNDPRQDYLSNNAHIESIRRIFTSLPLGLHGTKSASNNETELRQQWERINQTGLKVSGYRNHYLYFNYHKTFAMLERIGIDADYTLGFRENIGYRLGTSFPFQPYNLAQDRPYNITEYPLVVMDVTLFSRDTMNLTYKQAKNRVLKLLQHTHNTGGYISLLWHFHNFDFIDHPLWATLYWKIIVISNCQRYCTNN